MLGFNFCIECDLYLITLVGFGSSDEGSNLLRFAKLIINKSKQGNSHAHPFKGHENVFA